MDDLAIEEMRICNYNKIELGFLWRFAVDWSIDFI